MDYLFQMRTIGNWILDSQTGHRELEETLTARVLTLGTVNIPTPGNPNTSFQVCGVRIPNNTAVYGGRKVRLKIHVKVRPDEMDPAKYVKLSPRRSRKSSSVTRQAV